MSAKKDPAGDPPQTDRRPEDMDPRLIDYHLAERNTFLTLDPPLTSTDGFYYLRSNSAPPTTSQSSASRSSSTSTANTSSSQFEKMDQLLAKSKPGPPSHGYPEEDDDEDDLEDQLPAAPEASTAEEPGAQQPRAKKKRPCKSRRFRYESLLQRAEAEIRRNPDFDPEELIPPSFVKEDERLLRKLKDKMRQYKQDVLSGHPPREPPDGITASQMAAIARGVGQPNAASSRARSSMGESRGAGSGAQPSSASSSWQPSLAAARVPPPPGLPPPPPGLEPPRAGSKRRGQPRGRRTMMSL